LSVVSWYLHLQGSVARDSILNDQCITVAECDGERILIIGQHLPKLWAKNQSGCFSLNSVVVAAAAAAAAAAVKYLH